MMASIRNKAIAMRWERPVSGFLAFAKLGLADVDGETPGSCEPTRTLLPRVASLAATLRPVLPFPQREMGE